MKRKLLLAVIATCCATAVTFSQSDPPSIPCDSLPKKGTPEMAINDFANIIDAGTKTVLEQKLRTYWDTTQIAVAVITVPDMKGQEQFEYSLSLFRCWGIGGNGNDRGVLLFVSLNERKISIRTGYGIEFALTDLQSGEIIEEMKPYFKSGDHSKGIEHGVTSILSRLGTMSWEDRMQGIKEQKEAKERRSEERAERTKNVLLAGLAIGLLLFLVFQIRKLVRLKRLRTATKRRFNKINGEVTTAMEMVKRLEKAYDQTPSWAKKEAGAHFSLVHEHLLHAMQFLAQASALLHNDPHSANNKVRKATDLVEKSFHNFKKADQDLHHKIKQFSLEAPDRLSEAKKAVSSNIKKIEALREKGYRLEDALKEQLEFRKVLDTFDIANVDGHKKIWTETKVLAQKSDETFKRVEDLHTAVNNAECMLPEVTARSAKLFARAGEYRTRIDACKEQYPKSVWEPLEQQLKRTFRTLDQTEIEEEGKAILEYASMEKQRFSDAVRRFSNLMDLVTDAQSILNNIDATLTQQQQSKAEYADAYAKTKQVTEQALQKIKDSDVGSIAKKKAKHAAEQLTEVKVETKTAKTDWIALLLLLASISTLAEEAIRQANSDISDEEAKRRRERQRKRDREQSYHSNNDSYSTPFSDYGSSSSSSGSFGGFDGGSSGGGGADGGW